MDKQFTRNLENFAMQMLAAELIGAIIAMAVVFTLLYWAIRCGIRDGIKDSQRGERRTSTPRNRDLAHLPEMRAD